MSWLLVTNTQSCLVLCDPHGLGCFPSKNTRVGCHFLLQGILPTQGSNPHLLHCRQILYRWAIGEAPLIVLLRYNLYTIKFTSFKHVIPKYYYVYRVVPHITLVSNISITLRKNSSCCFAVKLSPYLQPQATTHLSSASTDLLFSGQFI